MRELKLIIIISLLYFSVFSQNSTYQIALLKYSGGGDWYANPTSLTNLISFCNKNINTNINTEYATVEPSSSKIFDYPLIHITGHGNVVFSDNDIKNLRNYLIGGGFLHIDDNYGLDQYIRPQIKKVFPELDFIELPFNHPIFNQKYKFTNGLPKIHEHDNKPPQAFGLFWNDRLICLYTYECDLGDGWEDKDVHNDSDDVRFKALQMGANIIQYVFSN